MFDNMGFNMESKNNEEIPGGIGGLFAFIALLILLVSIALVTTSSELVDIKRSYYELISNTGLRVDIPEFDVYKESGSITMGFLSTNGFVFVDNSTIKLYSQKLNLNRTINTNINSVPSGWYVIIPKRKFRQNTTFEFYAVDKVHIDKFIDKTNKIKGLTYQ